MAEDTTLTPEELDAKEWTEAAQELFPDKVTAETTTPETTTVETTTPETTTTDTTTAETTTPETTTVETTTTETTTPETTTPETTTPETTTAETTTQSNDALKPTETLTDTKPIEARMAQRAFEQSVEAVKSDVRQKMFGEMLTDLKDAQGTPITSAKDLENIINPTTSEAFTPEDANLAWGKYQQQRAAAESQVEQIAKVNVTLKDEADLVTSKYGKVLNSDPALKQRLFAQYEKSLEKDPNTGVIVKAPFSLLEYYDSILEPRLAADTQAQIRVQEAEAARVEAEKKAQEVKKVQTQSDRSDIFGAGKTGNLSKDEEEWNQAAKDYYGK